MSNFSLLPTLLAFLLISCGSSESTDQDFGKPPSAWSNLEELKKRPSPAKTVMEEATNGLKIALHYSSPYVKGRKIWGDLVPLDTVWRTGANEATIIAFNKDVLIADQLIKAGSYSFFTIPKENNWTLIINAISDQWGAYTYDPTKDVLRIEAENIIREPTENLSYHISTVNNGEQFQIELEEDLFYLSLYLDSQ